MIGDAHVAAIRKFNRFYTKQIGILQEGLLNSPFSLTEVRVLYELSKRAHPTAATLRKDLSLDAGYLSRILTGFERRGLLRKTPSETDRRQMLLSLTAKGQKIFAPLDQRADEEVRSLVGMLSVDEQSRLVRSMETVEELLGERSADKGPYILRPYEPGDMGWVVHRHGALYAQEYGLNDQFEALVAEIVAHFLRNVDPRRERCWIAEHAGEILGSVFLVRADDQVAKLRLLLVEPHARGLGIGGRLVAECVRFARHVGYRKITLWTSDVLVAARRVYEQAGFHLVEEKRHNMFGPDWVGQTWELTL
jgi:DNA-binding MarR family transcriptional regulator/GNAT superfamily N-acetyltransferase